MFALEAPSWHGRNLNALRDSMIVGGINQVEAPYRILFQNVGKWAPEVKAAILDTIDALTGEMAQSENGDIELVMREQEVPAPRR